jgi:hypothetical protein
LKRAFSGKIEGIESEEEMTRGEATAILNTEADFIFGNDKPYNRKAFDLAVEALQDCGKYKGAYDYIYKGVMSKIEECDNEEEILTTDLKAGEKGVGISKKCFALRVKKELLREIIYIVDEALEEGSAE